MNNPGTGSAHPLIGAAYIRVSTEDQIEYSPDSQLKKIREYAKAREICLPDEFIYMDEGISGRSAQKRPAFMEMIAAARSKPRPFDVILLWKFSRFARNRQDSVFYKSMLRKDCGIDVVSITEQLSGDPTSILIEALLEAMDEYYSINLAQEVRRGMNEKFSRGGVISTPPFGYRMGKEHFEPDENTAFLIPWIFERFAEGRACREIACSLNDMGIRTRRGRPFESRSVRYILSNPVYLGFLRKTDPKSPGKRESILVKGYHPPLITDSLFFFVQARLQKLEQQHTKKSRSAPAAFMLRGLVRCSCCGATLVKTGGKDALQCHRYARGQCSESHYVTLKALNRSVLCQMEADFASMACLHRKICLRLGAPGVPKPCTENSLPLSRLIQSEQARLSRIRLAYESGIDSLEEYRERKKKLEEQIQRLSEEQSAQTDDSGFGETSGNISGSYSLSFSGLLCALRSDLVTEAAKNEILRCMIKEITFWGTDRALQICYRS